jgi:hypothetical protein
MKQGIDIFEFTPYIVIGGISIFIILSILEGLFVYSYESYVRKQFPEIKMKGKWRCGFFPNLCYEDDDIMDITYLKLKKRIKINGVLGWIVLLTTGITALAIFIFFGPRN